MTFIEPGWLTAMIAAPVVLALLAYAAWRRERTLRQFAGESADRAARASRAARRFKGVCVVVAVALLGMAMARPGANPTPQKIDRAGRDIVILLDVSRSMLAGDLKPNRLERAKIIIRDMLDAARGDRVAIIAFAGSTVLRCPLTTDYSFARLSLETISPDVIPKGGTLIGDAIRSAMEQVFTDGDERYRDIVLITDGEDHESMPLQAAQEAGKRGIRIIAIGLGSDAQGATIPVDGTKQVDSSARVLTYQGSEVRTRMDTKSLRDIAEASRDGVFLNVGVGTIQMDKVYRTLVQRAERRELESTERVRYTELFQIALGAALALLVIDSLVSERRRHGSFA